jgi:Zn-finger nucleic acid-binding protein
MSSQLDGKYLCFICDKPILTEQYLTGIINFNNIGKSIVSMHTDCAEKHKLDICGNCQKVIFQRNIFNWDYHVCNECIGTVRLKKEEKKTMITFIRKSISRKFIGFSHKDQRAYFETQFEMSDDSVQTKYQFVDFSYFSSLMDEKPEVDASLPKELKTQFGSPLRKHDILIEIHNDGLIVWADPGKSDKIAMVPGVAQVDHYEYAPTRYYVDLDPRYDRKEVEQAIKYSILS